MNQKLKTSLAFAKNLLVTGAISETSRYVEVNICKHISKEPNKIIVEFGTGHGNITKEILNTMSDSSTLYSFEVNEEFCEHVRETIEDKRLIIINDGAENLNKHVKTPINSVISSIPFTFFSKKKGLSIIQNAYNLLENNGYYNQVLYTKFNFKKFQKIFDHCTLITHKNLITEYIYYCKKSSE
ncbi:MAG: class I SAM-dependent methyltransferase [Flavobacteriales bacterium]